ncbi:short-subunit dehydrogenase [Modicisalibacter xianhensis]|uniref:Short-subunit dehydrogenase n=1 Tax=Modicisalibacter xianhensis TaxID=442341 RepID=A0A4R8FPW8_9GAMM|nr:SDR family oxidoreductase [Halomonas xianhensis]TDX28375.1 short-subunit dehydrogenase [Halomonas xianhensis]
MQGKLKPSSRQVIVITGATSGIGLVTAREAARRGASLVLAARNEAALIELVEELAMQGCQAIHVIADVGLEADIDRVVSAAVGRFGGFDTWVNNAGVSIYGPLEAASTVEYRRLFDTNFWGVVFGSLAARKLLRQRGGAIITVGSAASEFALPVQGMYSPSKHAIKGFIDAFRLETEQERLSIAVTLIKPASINTRLPDHAVNHTSRWPRLPPPIYAPETVARAILYAAEHPTRELFVGASGRLVAAGRQLLPHLIDKFLNTFARSTQAKGHPDRRTDSGILFHPGEGLHERHADKGMTLEFSPYTRAMTHGRWYTLSLLAAVTTYGLLRYRRHAKRH